MLERHAVKADLAQQRSLLELAELDAELARLSHRAANLPEQQSYDTVAADHREAGDRLAALAIALEDVDAQVTRFESEIDGVRQREDRDRKLLDSGATNPKQLEELQHELETLERRQSNLEDSLLEVMERLEQLAGDQSGEVAKLDALQGDLAAAAQARDEAVAEIERVRIGQTGRREQLVAALDPGLVELYERQRKASGAGAARLLGKRCGACRIELDRGEMARISAAPDDDIIRCPECQAILLRVGGA
jgi:predicted  nucleic acid-binding Zn-ribbon protein